MVWDLTSAWYNKEQARASTLNVAPTTPKSHQLKGHDP
jgi:hypothetical protein